MNTILPFTCALTVLPGRDSIHSTAWFIAHERAQVTLPTISPTVLPPKAIVAKPQGTNEVASGRTMRLVKRK